MNLIRALPNPSWTIEQLRKHFGMIPAERIRLEPPPGTASEEDAEHINEKKLGLCELVDGVLVEKATGMEGSSLGLWLAHFLWIYLEKHNRGKLTGAACFYQLTIGLIRAPAIAFTSWDRWPKKVPAVPRLAPDVLVEVIKEGNTRSELERKRREYFTHGARLVWEVDPRSQAVDVYTSRTNKTRLVIGDTLDGGDVLPGFKLSVKKLFSPPQRPRR